MTHYTITPSNSIYMPGTALTLRAGHDLTILSGGYLAGDATGLALAGDNAVSLRGEVSGDTAVTFAGTAQMVIGTGGAILGGAHAISGAGQLGITNWGEILNSATDLAPTIQVTGGHVVRLDNHGLIGTAQPMSQSGLDLVADITSNRFFLTNDGMIAGQIRSDISLHRMITNAGTIAGGLWTLGEAATTITNRGTIGDSYLLSGGSLVNSGTMGNLNLGGGWEMDMTGGRVGDISGNVAQLELIGTNATFGGIHLTQVGEGPISSIRMSGLDGSHFDDIWVQGEGTLNLTGTTIRSLHVEGRQYVTLTGAKVGGVVADGAWINASGLAERTHMFRLELGNETLWGSQFDDVIWDMGGSDWLDLGGGDDIFDVQVENPFDEPWRHPISEGGADTIRGGAGFDIYNGSIWVPILADLRAQSVAERLAGGQIDEVWEIEAVSGGLFDDILRGDGKANALYGGIGGDDILVGRGGDDTLAGGNGHNRLRGGAGADVFIGSWQGDNLILDFQTGLDRIDLTQFDLDFRQEGRQGLTWGEGPGQALLEARGDLAHLRVLWTDGAEVLTMEIRGAVSTADFIL